MMVYYSNNLNIIQHHKLIYNCECIRISRKIKIFGPFFFPILQ